ncbi:MAG: PEP-CTERM sorting domain-containing protein [Phycisphaerae bacterium]
MRMICGVLLISLMVLGSAGTSSAQTVLNDFETGGAQGWSAFGPLTTDSGQNAGDTGLARFHAANYDLAGWGIVDIGPVVDLSSFVGIGVDARLRNVAGFPAYGGTKIVDFGLDIGGVEYFTQISLTDVFQSFSVNFVDLVPAPPSQNALQIKLRVLDGVNGSTGTGELNYDNVIGIIPEPSTVALVGLGAIALLRRRRSSRR